MHLHLSGDMVTCGRDPKGEGAADVYEHCVVTVAHSLQTHSSV